MRSTSQSRQVALFQRSDRESPGVYAGFRRKPLCEANGLELLRWSHGACSLPFSFKRRFRRFLGSVLISAQQSLDQQNKDDNGAQNHPNGDALSIPPSRPNDFARFQPKIIVSANDRAPANASHKALRSMVRFTALPCLQ